MQPKVAVIILNWNGEKLLREFLPSVLANTPASLATVIVADNGSSDASLQAIESMRISDNSPSVISFPQNYGFARGYNMAIEQTHYQYTVLLNSDVSTPAGWLEPLLDFMESHPDVGACQPKLLSYREPKMFEYAGAAGGFLDKNGYPYCRGRIFDTCEEDCGQYDQSINVFWATGAALMVRTSVYLQAGGLDPDFFAHMEEIDLCWRMQLLGYEIAVVPQSRVYHLGGGSLPASDPRKTYLNFRNNLLMMHKNLPDSSRSRRLLVRRLLDAAAWAKFLVSGQWGSAKAVIRAHRDFAKMRSQYAEHPTVDLLSNPTNILVKYYLQGKKKFADI